MHFEWTREFKKQYKKLPPKIQGKVQERLRLFLVNEFNPVFQNHKLSGEFRSFRSIHITGDYRMHYYRYNADLVILASVGTHAQLYD